MDINKDLRIQRMWDMIKKIRIIRHGSLSISGIDEHLIPVLFIQLHKSLFSG